MLTASYFFYTYWKIEYALLIVLSTVTDYFIGIAIHRAKTTRIKKSLLYISISVNIGILFFFKYFNFLNKNISSVLSGMGMENIIPYTDFLLPVGISFYTFQTLSYSVDIYNGKINPEKHLGYFALFVSFFPQLVAGPIERAGNLLGQLKGSFKFDVQNIAPAVKLILWGYFKKIVIADRLAMYVDPVYDNASAFGTLSLVMATILFAFQIYCDFSGYSDIAIGVAKLFGINLMKNFERPYLSKSIGEFWKRWHISLSTWFRDYVYIPLGGNKVIKIRWYYNLIVTFLISGLWHGANWTFAVWGILHCSYLIIEKLFHLNVSSPLWIRRQFRVILTFFLVCFAWIFFRANDLTIAIEIIQRIGLFNLDYALFYEEAKITGISKLDFILSFVFLIFLTLVEKSGIKVEWPSKYVSLRFLFYYFIIFSIIFFGVDGREAFIYFQF